MPDLLPVTYYLLLTTHCFTPCTTTFYSHLVHDVARGDIGEIQGSASAPISPLHLPCISPASPLYLPCIPPASPCIPPASPLYLPCISLHLVHDVAGAQLVVLVEIWARYARDMREIWARYGRDMGEIQDAGAQLVVLVGVRGRAGVRGVEDRARRREG